MSKSIKRTKSKRSNNKLIKLYLYYIIMKFSKKQINLLEHARMKFGRHDPRYLAMVQRAMAVMRYGEFDTFVDTYNQLRAKTSKSVPLPSPHIKNLYDKYTYHPGRLTIEDFLKDQLVIGGGKQKNNKSKRSKRTKRRNKSKSNKSKRRK